ncbi:MAG: DUF2065 domain-containing protein [Burkholderiaceae bacterium]|nr:DUF2065 domain-containing protein [Burkholderiaceae bacterium]
MNSDILWAALALVLVIEGFFPFLSPSGWKRSFAKIIQLSDGQIRLFGLCSVLLGLFLLWLTID